MADFRMPSLGADMEFGTIVKWLVQEGDAVKKGDVVAIVDTDKATIEVEVFEGGTIGEIVVPTGREVPVGTVLATIVPMRAAPSREQEPVPAPAARPQRAPRKRAKPKPASPEPAVAAAPVLGRHVRSSPRARRLASERGLDLTALAGSGPGGAIVAADVAALSTADISAPSVAERTKPATTAAPPDPRAPIAKLMARSKREIPHYYLATTIDMQAALDAVAAWNEGCPPTERLLPAALLLKATALATRVAPSMHGTWTDHFVPADELRLGVAVSLRGGGLVAPAIADADELSLADLMAELRGLVARVRSGRLRASDVADPTITVTNLGEGSVDEVFGVIYPPQVALVGFGGIVRRPWVVGDRVEVRPVLRATLAADHRASDGHDGTGFLAAIDRLLQQPEEL